MRIAAMALALAASACSNTIAAKRPLDSQTVKEINGVLEGHKAVVVVSGEDGAPSNADVVAVGADSTVIDNQKQVPTASIERITVIRRGLGALEGLGFGFLGGAVVGAVIGAAAASGADPDCNNSAGCLYPAIGAGLGGVLGILAGTIIGTVIGHQTTIDFRAGAVRPDERRDAVPPYDMFHRVPRRREPWLGAADAPEWLILWNRCPGIPGAGEAARLLGCH